MSHHRSIATSATAPPTRAALAAWAESNRPVFEAKLRELVETPSVSMEPDRHGDVLRMATAAVEWLRELGFAIEVYETAGNPVIFGRREVDPSLPTVTIYNHLDVQPANEPEWQQPNPFEMQVQGDRYFGRGTTDDKGPAVAAVMGAVHGQETGARVNLQVIWELEEEIGSPYFDEAMRKLVAQGHKTDVVVVSDTVWIARGKPAMVAGLRGLQTYLLTLEVGATDQHSGTAGGAARNPVAELCQVAAACVDGRTGRCKVPGFYRDVTPPTRQELEDLRRCGFSVAQFKRDHGFKSLRTRDRMDVMQRIWMQPTFEVHGLTGGYAGPGVKTVIPPRAELKVSTRLVPDQDPARIARLLQAHVRKLNPDVKVKPQHALRAYRGPTTGPHVDAVRRSIEFAFGRKPVFVREGGSIGAVLTMQQLLKAPVMFLGLSLPEHGYHAPNENFDWGQASGGMMAFAALAHELAAVKAK